jgi:hypothetical protein
MTSNATTNERSGYGSGGKRVYSRFRAFAATVVAVALLVLIASLPVARIVVDSTETRPFGAVVMRSSGGSQFATYNVPHMPPESPLGKQKKRERKRASLKATGRVTSHRGRTLRLLDSSN